MTAIHYDAPPTLSRFFASSAFVRVVEGPIGSGKSSACVLELLRRATAQAPDAAVVRRTRFAVIRNTYPQLRDTTAKTFSEWVPERLGRWNREGFTFTADFRLADGTRVVSEILFRALDKPADVGKVLSLELTGAYVNELREIPKEILDGIQSRVDRYPSRRDTAGASWAGVWADTNPWHYGHWLDDLEAKWLGQGLDGYEFFRQPGGREPEAENRANLPPTYYTRLMAGKDAEWVATYIDCRRAKSDKGSVFGALMAGLDARDAFVAFEHPNEDVMTSWDLGIGDACAIWFWRLNASGTADVIDFYAAAGLPLSHYLDVLDRKGYSYAKHWLPHDARARTLQTGVSTVELVSQRFGAARVAITPELSLEDGLGAARWHLEQPGVRFHERCGQPVMDRDGAELHASGLKSLREYRYAWDEARKIYSRIPLHNWASNPADAWRYVSCVVKVAELHRPSPPARATPQVAAGVSLDDAWRDTPARSTGRV